MKDSYTVYGPTYQTIMYLAVGALVEYAANLDCMPALQRRIHDVRIICLAPRDQGGCESEIERMFIAAFGLLGTGMGSLRPEASEPYGRMLLADMGAAPPEAGDYVLIEVQKTLDNGWRLDFALTVFRHTLPIGRIAIECDGHDYHERTKEQAARDRSRDRTLQAQGWLILRFTGAEIYRDALSCTLETREAISRIVGV